MMRCLCEGGNQPNPSCDGCDSLTTSDNPYDENDSWYDRQIASGNIPAPEGYWKKKIKDRQKEYRENLNTEFWEHVGASDRYNSFGKHLNKLTTIQKFKEGMEKAAEGIKYKLLKAYPGLPKEWAAGDIAELTFLPPGELRCCVPFKEGSISREEAEDFPDFWERQTKEKIGVFAEGGPIRKGDTVYEVNFDICQIEKLVNVTQIGKTDLTDNRRISYYPTKDDAKAGLLNYGKYFSLHDIRRAMHTCGNNEDLLHYLGNYIKQQIYAANFDIPIRR